MTGMKPKRILVAADDLRFLFEMLETLLRQSLIESGLTGMDVALEQSEEGLSISRLREARELRRHALVTGNGLEYVQALKQYYLAKDPTKLEKLFEEWRKTKKAKA